MSIDAVPKKYKTTAEVQVPGKIIDQVIGQDESVELIKKAAAQKRNVLLVGIPGTGKSLMAQAMAEILPLEKLNDILIYPNPGDPNNPRVRTVPAGDGKKIVRKIRMEAQKEEQNMRMVGMIFPLGWFLLSFIIWSLGWVSDVIYAATLIMGGFLIVGFAIGTQVRPKQRILAPKLLVDNYSKKIAPFFEGTGARSGALLGDVRHDPLQCFYGFSRLYIEREGQIEDISFIGLWDQLSTKNTHLVKTTKEGYEFMELPATEKVYTMGFKDGNQVLSRILSLNRQPYEGKIVDLKVGNKTVSVTPEHNVVTATQNKEASHITPEDDLILFKELKELASASFVLV